MEDKSKYNFITKALKQKSKRRPTSMYLRLEDKKELMAECGDAATILFEYYLSKAGMEEYEYTDSKVSNALGWSLRKVQETRKKLTKAGYFFQQFGRYNKGNKIITTYLGKAQVESIKTELEHYEKTGEKDE
jgi:hypothetical protein